MSIKNFQQWTNNNSIYESNIKYGNTRFTKKSKEKFAFLNMFKDKYADHSTSGRIKNLKGVSIEELIKDLENFYGKKLEYVIVLPGEKPININQKSQYSSKYPTVEYKLDGKWYYLTLTEGDKGHIKITPDVYEMGIVYAYNTFVEGFKREDALKLGKIDLKYFEIYEDYIIDICKRIALNMPKQNSYLVWSGSDRGITIDWESNDATSKTDFYSKQNRYFLKMAGGSQLMSGSAEAVSIFKAALDYYEYHDKNLLEEEMVNLIENIKSKFININNIDTNISIIKSTAINKWIEYRVPMIKNIAKRLLDKKIVSNEKKFQKAIMAHAKAEIIRAGIGNRIGNWENWFIKGIEDGEKVFKEWWEKEFLNDLEETQRNIVNKILKATLNHRFLQEKLTELFTKNPEFLKWIIYEAATGNRKFTGQIEKLANEVDEKFVADNIFVFRPTGEIEKIEEITPEWSKKYTKYVKTKVSFKTSNKRASSAFRLIVDNFNFEYSIIDKIFEEEIKNFKQEIILINKGIKDIINNDKSLAKNIWDKLLNAIKKFYNNIIKKIINTLYEWAKKGIREFASLFGLIFQGEATVNINF